MLHGRNKEYLKGTRRHGNVRLPIRQFLFSKVGRQWSEVHSELSREFDRRTYAGYRFWRTFTYRHSWYNSNVVTGCWIGAETGTIYNGDAPVEGFFEHPFTGVLSYKAPTRWISSADKSITRIIIDSRYAYEKIEGIWYHTTYIPNIYYHKYSLFESKPYEITHQRQLNHKQLRDLSLENNTPEEVDKIKKQIAAKEKAERDACKARMLAMSQGAS